MTTSVQRLIASRELGGAAAGASLRKSDIWASRYEVSSVLAHHGGCVNSLSWCADGCTLLSGSDDRTVGVWSFSSSWEGKLRGTLRTLHSNNIFDAQQCPFDPHLVITTAADGCVGLTTEDGDPCMLFETPPMMPCVSSKLAFQPGSSRVVLVPFSSGHVRLFDLRDPSSVKAEIALRINGARGGSIGANDVKFRPWSSSQFAVAADDWVIRLYDLRYPTSVMVGLDAGSRGRKAECVHAEAAACFAHAGKPPGATVGSGPFGEEGGISGVAWSRSGQQLLVNFRGADLALFDLPCTAAANAAAAYAHEDRGSAGLHTRPLAARQSYSGRVNADTCCKEAVFLLDERCVATGGDCGGLFIWRAESGRLLRHIVADRCVVNSVAAHPSLPLLACSGIDPEVKIIDVGSEWQGARLDGADAHERRALGGSWHERLQRERALSAREALDATREAAGLREQGNAAFREGRLDAAAERYGAAEAALHFVPPNASLAAERRALLQATRLNLSLCMLRLGRHASAIAYCNRVLETEPTCVKALFRRASALLDGPREFDDAERDVLAALELEPANAELLRLRHAVRAARAAERRAESARYRAMFSGGDASD